MRRMSFRYTADAVRSQQKTVTRRLGWEFLKEGDRLIAVDRIRVPDAKVIGCIEIVSVRKERILDVTHDEVRREGLKHGECWCKRKKCDTTGPRWCFINMFCDAMGVAPDHVVNRIEFRYIDLPLGSEVAA